jgi:glycosyltransferase involved in cell wall biosynthesis
MLIPAYNPSEEPACFVERLAFAKVRAVIVVNDGNGPGFGPTFQKLQGGRVVLLEHAANPGKGAALKTGLHYAYSNFQNIS